MGTLVKLVEKERVYLPQTFKISVWSKLKPYYHELVKRPIENTAALEKWIADWCELNDVVGEEFRWRYIRFTCDNEDEKAMESYNYAVQELSPRISPYTDQLNRKLNDSPFKEELDTQTYFIFLRSIKNDIDLYQEENVSIVSDIKMRSKNHGRLFSKMIIKHEGQELTIQQARKILEDADRPTREMIYSKINARVREDRDELDSTFDDLLQLRHQLALNAGFENYRDYKFQALHRFDYKVEDCFDFHQSIAETILPILKELNLLRKKSIGVDTLRPWDTVTALTGNRPKEAFQSVDELIKKSVQSLHHINPLFGEVLNIMNQRGHLDLASRPGKRPGGYNMPLPVSGIPFIFMNAANSIKDVRTMMHETGHAVHSYLIREYELNTSKNLPSEIAELAAMTMELLTMDYWDTFYSNEEELRQAKIWQLEKVLVTLPWVATIDKFQHWLYTHPEHSAQDRIQQWRSIFYELNNEGVDWTGLEHHIDCMWHRQLHIFEVPFYYIEYGMAQLGAIAIWRNFRQNPQKAITDYTNALKLGYTRSIPEVYEMAGIEFNFSKAYVKELGDFVKKELERLLF